MDLTQIITMGNSTMRSGKKSTRRKSSLHKPFALLPALLIGIIPTVVLHPTRKISTNPDVEFSQYVWPGLDERNDEELKDGSLPADGMVQPMLHITRLNNIQVNEMIHIFNRIHELSDPNFNNTATAAQKKLCFSGIGEEMIDVLSNVWTVQMRGKIGLKNPAALGSHEKFQGCDAIVVSGGSYSATATWAFQSSIPVINLWNTDGYWLQPAMLHFYNRVLAYKSPEELFSPDVVLRLSGLYHDSAVGDGMWADSRLEAFTEMTKYFYNRPLQKCPPTNSRCKHQIVDLDAISGPSLGPNAASLVAALVEFALAKSGKLPNSYLYPGIRCEPGVIVSGKFNFHDPNIAYVDSGKVLFDLQWERVTKKKFSLAKGGKVVGFEDATRTAQAYAAEQYNVTDVNLAVIVRDPICLEMGASKKLGGRRCPGETQLPTWLPEKVPVMFYEHLWAHTTQAFLDSPFETAIVIAMHGMGSEAYQCGVYLTRRNVQPILLKLCGATMDDFGMQYFYIGGHFTEVVPNGGNEFIENMKRGYYAEVVLSWAGVFMGYTGLGKAGACVEQIATRIFTTGMRQKIDILKAIQDECTAIWSPFSNNVTAMEEFPRHLPVEIQRDIATTFEEIFEHAFLHLLDDVQDEVKSVEGIALGGGCALNVKAAQRTWNHWNKPVHIPSAPSDDGIAIGGAWGICQPPRASVPLQYHGLPLFDRNRLDEHARAWGSSCEYLGLTESAAMRLATLLAVEKKIVAVVLGNQEFGPRALSHRSLMAYPDSLAIRERMNALKYRKFYRPTCPTMTEEFVDQLFQRPETVKSPFMSFAPELQSWVGDELPAVKHFDNTARPQTLSKSTEPFVHSMLQAIPKVLSGGKPVVINTSFNIKGQPIINTIEDSLFMLCDRRQLDYLFLEGYLFSLPANATLPICEKHLQRLGQSKEAKAVAG